MPPGIYNAYLFQLLNTISYSIVAGVPMMLYVQNLGASAAIIAIIGALPNLLNILQIPAAYYLERIGYRLFVLRGWSIRTIFILAIAGIAFWPRLDSSTRLGLTLFLYAGYNIARGFSVAGFLPWVASIVPEEQRGRFLSIDQFCMNLGALMNLVAIALFVHQDTSLREFGILFSVSFFSALGSLYFLNKMPDAPPATVSKTSEPVPWRVMLKYAPFQRIVIYSTIIHVTFAGMSFIWVPMTKNCFGFNDAHILLLGASGSAMAMIALSLGGAVIDRVGNRKLLLFSLLITALHLIGWASLASSILPLNAYTLAFQQITAGFAAPLFTLANSRSLMATIPQMGRSHFFAIYSVVTSLILGIVPVLWGLILDTFKDLNIVQGRISLNAFSSVYILMAGVAAVAFFQATKIQEPRRMTTDEFLRELFIKTPARALSRIFTRRSIP
ncbi:MAG: MFS transporter [Methylacidiphilales bacterium]|nr:MFS transporter [Candidatus Methylacidiphilales bacterium]MDW8349276.1 MFS transporter [Verrucomicrobiae bacterium]